MTFSNIVSIALTVSKLKNKTLANMAQLVPVALGLSFTTGTAVTGGLLVDLVDKARTAGSTTERMA